jgi:DNA-binding NarL/FixJ family response regulator
MAHHHRASKKVTLPAMHVRVHREYCSLVGRCRMEVKQLRTVVVDDSEAMLRIICTFLKSQPDVVVVATANNGQEALAAVDVCLPELVLLDIQMPELNGIEAATQLSGKYPSLKIAIVTAHDTAQLRQACRDAGARWFVTKQRLGKDLPCVIREATSGQYFPSESKNSREQNLGVRQGPERRSGSS